MAEFEHSFPIMSYSFNELNEEMKQVLCKKSFSSKFLCKQQNSLNKTAEE